jgi:serine/threonine protein kinase
MKVLLLASCRKITVKSCKCFFSVLQPPVSARYYYESSLGGLLRALTRYLTIVFMCRCRAGTPIYIAPEVLKMQYGHKSDVWSTGITAYQLLTGRLPFYGEEGLEVRGEWPIT